MDVTAAAYESLASGLGEGGPQPLMSVRVHPTALVEEGVTIGEGTAIWDNAHVRAPSSIGAQCIIGEKTYVAYGVTIGDLVKINAFVYICTAVTSSEA